MENLILPGFFKIRNPQVGVNEDEPNFIKFAINEYKNDGNSYIVKLGCINDVYELFNFTKVTDEPYAVAFSTGMDMYIRMELAKAISLFINKNVIITNFYGISVTNNRAEVGIEFEIAEFISNQDYTIQRGINRNLYICKVNAADELIHDFSYSSRLLRTTTFDAPYFNTKNFYTVKSVLHKETGIKLYSYLRISYEEFKNTSFDELITHVSPQLKNNCKGVDECISEICSEILNQFIIYCNARDISIGLTSCSTRMHSLYSYLVFANRNDVEIVVYAKNEFIADNNAMHIDYNLQFDEKSSIYSMEISLDPAFCALTIKYAKKIIDKYKFLINTDNEDMDNVIKTILKTEAVMITEDTGILQALFDHNDGKDNDDESIFKDLDALADPESYDANVDCVMKMSSLLAHTAVEDMVNYMLQCQTINRSKLFLNAYNITTVTKNENIPKLFINEDDDDMVWMREIDSNAIAAGIEEFDPRLHFRKDGEYVEFNIKNPDGSLKSSNKNFNKIMGNVIDIIPCVLSDGAVYICENGNFIVTDMSTVSSDDALCTVLNEYDIIMMNYQIKEKNKSIGDIIRPSLCNLSADGCFVSKSFETPRRIVPVRFIVLGAFTMPNNNS